MKDRAPVVRMEAFLTCGAFFFLWTTVGVCGQEARDGDVPDLEPMSNTDTGSGGRQGLSETAIYVLLAFAPVLGLLLLCAICCGICRYNDSRTNANDEQICGDNG